MSNPLNDPWHWHSRAEEARALAKTMGDDREAQQRMFEVATNFDHIADLAANRLKRAQGNTANK
jgi:hypothetical protein